jgi:Calcineurin-like phosphoesterase/PKD domain
MFFLLIAESFPFSANSSSSFSSNLTATPNTFTFGNTAVGTYFDQNDANAKSVSNFRCSNDGQITDIYAYVARAYSTGTGKAAIYADDSGQPGALIAQSFAVSITSSYSWVDFELPSPVRVNSGAVYWLAICSDEPLRLSIVLDSGVRALNGNSYSEGFSDPFGYLWATDPTGAMSIYASGNMDSSELSVSISPTSTNIVLGGSQQFTSSVTGGISPYSYQWYVNDTAVSGGTSQNWIFAPTTAGTYKIYLEVTDFVNSKTQSNIVTDIRASPSQYDFSIMQISDTQNLAWTHPDWYNQLTTWIIDNSAAYNLKMVIHTGDLTENYDQPSEWQNANAAMSILADNGVPYTWCAGNHDQNGMDNPNSGWFGDQYSAFNPATFSGNSYWVGDDNQGKNTAVKFSFNGYNFLVINLECQANAATMAWATNLLDTYSSLNYNIIVGTHAFLDSPNMMFTQHLPATPIWEENFQNLLNSYPRVFMTLNGHTGGWPPGFSVHNQVNGRTQTEFDRQDVEIDEAAAVRIYSFDLDNNIVTASTYSVPTATWITDSGDNFSFSADLLSTPKVSITPSLVRMVLGQSQRFSSSVSGGMSPYSYQWYLNNAAVLGATSQDWTFTPSTTGNYEVYVTVTDDRSSIVQSNVVTDINVYPELTTSINPSLTSMSNGTTQQFTSITSGGFTPYTYQWFLNGNQISNAKNSTWKFTPTSSGTFSIYLVVSDNNTAISQSNNATVVVKTSLDVIITPTQVDIYLGQSRTFISNVSGGTTPYSYQWYLNDTAVTGATSQNWTFTPTITGHYKISLNITDALNSKTQSNIVTDITVYSALTASISPSTVNMTVGMQQTFNSTISGGAQPYTYHWYLNGNPVPNTNSSSWTFIPTASGNFTIYLTVTDNNTQSVKSNIATITTESTSVITGFIVESGGSGYTTPHVVLIGGGGTGATAVARVSQGVVIALTLTNPGTGYTSAPTVTLRDPSPRAKGATATAVLATL